MGSRIITLSGSKIIKSRAFSQQSFEEVVVYTEDFQKWMAENSEQIKEFHEDWDYHQQTNIISLEFFNEEDALLFAIMFKSG